MIVKLSAERNTILQSHNQTNLIMTTNRLLKTVLLFFIAFQLHAYNYINVQDPQFWDRDNGTIEEAQFTVHPRGAYMEVGMYLTLSAGNSRLEGHENPLEITMGFDLPDGAMVIDSWLWINDYVVRADIKDRWSASAIYEDIVGRRQDPSILFKQNDNQYELRVYPLQSDSTRRVKVTYLVPGNWSDGKVSIPLPTELLRSSQTPLANIQVQTFLNNDFKNPRFEQPVEASFLAATHATLGNHLAITIDANDLKSSLDLSLEVPMDNGVYLSTYQGKEENFYQMVLLPTQAFPIQKNSPKKVAVLIDYATGNSSLGKSAVVNEVRQRLLQHLTDQDQFNIFLSQADISPVSNEWLPADDATVNATFDAINSSSISTFSNLPNLLLKGINYIQDQGTGGELLLVSSATQVGQPEAANGYIEELRDLMSEELIPIHVSDYQDQNMQYFWINGTNYQGNEYFYSNITRLTNGEMNTIREHRSFSNTINNSLIDVAALEGILDVHTTLSDGFCYGRHDVSTARSFSSINHPLIQVGKYQGSFPFQIEASGVVNGEFFGGKMEIPSTRIEEGTTIHQTIWAGNYIQELEQENRTNSVVKEIIDWSLENRVLSFFTAFLALEIEQGGVACEDCVDETELDQIVVIQNDQVNDPNEPNKDSDTAINLPTDNPTDIATEDGPAPPLGAPPAAGPTGPAGPSGPTGGGTTGGGTGGGNADASETVTAINEVLADSLVHITASPNPFSEQTTITVKLGTTIDASQVSYAIYNVNGNRIRQFKVTPNSDNRYQFTWDGTDASGQTLAKGMYLFNVRTERGMKNLKLLYLK